MAARIALAHAVLLLVDLLQAAADTPVQDAERAIDALLPQAAFQHRDAVAQRLRGLGARGGDAVEELVARADHHLGSGGGRGSAQIGHEIGDGDIGLVAHGGDHGHGTGGDGARHGLFVEGPEIFQGAAAAGDNHHVRPLGAAEIFDAAADFFHRALALHQSREEADVQTGEAALQNLDHIRDGGAARRGDDPDTPGEARHGTLAFGREETFGGKFLFELLEGQLQRAQSLRFEQFDQQLVFAAGFVDIDAAARQHGESVARLEFPEAVGGAEGYGLHLGFAVLQSEVVVAAGGEFEARDFACHRDIGELAVEHGADRAVEFTDAVDAALRKEVEAEFELLH